MHDNFRQSLFTIFAIFYIILFPFLVILSLGYNVDFKHQGLDNTLNIKIETYPRGAEIPTNKETFKTPADLKTSTLLPFTLRIQSQDYLEERFKFTPKPNANSTARLQELWLLPKNTSLDLRFENAATPLSILNVNTVLFQKNKDYFVQGYSFAGFLGKENKIKKPPLREIKPGSWEKLLENAFWSSDQDFLLFKNLDEAWEIIDLEEYPVELVSLARVSKKQILGLDKSGNLWIIDLVTKEIQFLDNDYLGLTFTETPDNIWLLKESAIYRLSRNTLSVANFKLEESLFLADEAFLDFAKTDEPRSLNSFIAKNLFLGNGFKIQDKVIYIPDSDKNSWLTIASDVQSIGTNKNTLFWMNKSGFLYSYNLQIQNQESFGKIPIISNKPEQFKLYYYWQWKRLFIYTDSEVFSIWYDIDVANDSIAKYYSNLWIKQSQCLPEIIDSYQFCLNENRMVNYKNNSLPF